MATTILPPSLELNPVDANASTEPKAVVKPTEKKRKISKRAPTGPPKHRKKKRPLPSIHDKINVESGMILPVNELAHIFGFLDYRTLIIIVSSVCKLWNSIAASSELWSAIIFRDFGQEAKIPSVVSYKHILAGQLFQKARAENKIAESAVLRAKDGKTVLTINEHKKVRGGGLKNPSHFAFVLLALVQRRWYGDVYMGMLVSKARLPEMLGSKTLANLFISQVNEYENFPSYLKTDKRKSSKLSYRGIDIIAYDPTSVTSAFTQCAEKFENPASPMNNIQLNLILINIEYQPVILPLSVGKLKEILLEKKKANLKLPSGTPVADPTTSTTTTTTTTTITTPTTAAATSDEATPESVTTTTPEFGAAPINDFSSGVNSDPDMMDGYIVSGYEPASSTSLNFSPMDLSNKILQEEITSACLTL